MSSSTVNYARLEGIQHGELPADIVFTVLYAPCLVIFIVLSFIRPTFVWRFLAIFSVIRLAAFTIRSILAGSSTAGTNRGLYIAEQVIYSIGFFGLLYSSYILVLDRDIMVNGSNAKQTALPGPLGFITRLARNRTLVRLALLAAVGLGVVAGIKQGSDSSSSQSTGNDLRKVSIIIFVVVACVLLLVTLILTYNEHKAGMLYEVAPTIGKRYGTVILLVIATFCMVREAFLCATLGNTEKQNQPSLFYPLAASPELVAALLFLIQGLVPSKYELEARREEAQRPRGDGYAMSNVSPQTYGSDPRFASRV